MFFLNLILCFFIILFPACIPQQHLSHVAIQKADIPLFIEMPPNDMVFDNISPLVYQALFHHYQKIGYRLVNKRSDGYVLVVKIKNLDPLYKLVSPDILLFHSMMKLELFCQLFNFDNTLVTQKTFFFTSLISKPRSPILNSDFLEFNYKRLFARSVPKIEQYMRPFLLKAFE